MNNHIGYKEVALIKTKQNLAILLVAKSLLHDISTVSRDYVDVILFHRQNVLEVKEKHAYFLYFDLIINLRFLHTFSRKENISKSNNYQSIPSIFAVFYGNFPVMMSTRLQNYRYKTYISYLRNKSKLIK